MGINSTPEEKEQFKALNRLRMKSYRDKTRKLKYAPRGKYRDNSCVHKDGELK
ncbi:MAG: hypothetical protein PHC63_06975 [Candidatus Bathyarchaeota archaeon]|nr:hypothetical protein [Candidatus Bathyarchaeota archaeon]